MSRKTSTLTPAALAGLPPAERSCLSWELPPGQSPPRSVEAATARRRAWVEQVRVEWGTCGQVLEVDGVTAGIVTYAPAVLVPREGSLPSSPASPDAVVLTHLWVHPSHRGGGLGKVLVQAMARDLVRRGDAGAVEAYATTETFAAGVAPPGPCLVPAGFLGAVGFHVEHAHPTRPRYRLELTRTLTWRDGVEEAWHRLVTVVRPRRTPASAPVVRSAVLRDRPAASAGK